MVVVVVMVVVVAVLMIWEGGRKEGVGVHEVGRVFGIPHVFSEASHMKQTGER